MDSKRFPSVSISILITVFLLSGFAGLIYESIWTHYLKLFLGCAAYAQTLVLIIYMGGMALGSWLASLVSARTKNLLVSYAAAELAVGITALVFHDAFVTYLSVSYRNVIPALGSPLVVDLYKWTTASMLILPQSILLGATFPLMSGGLIRSTHNHPGRTISVLYFVNSLGAAIGVLASGFIFIEKAGLPGTIRIAGVIDIAIAAITGIVCFLPGVGIEKKTSGGDSSSSGLKIPPPPVDRTVRLTLYGAAFCTAASSFMYEIGFIRMLSLVLGSSTHAFELMLSAFILGIAIGGFWIKNKIDGFKNPLTVLAVIQVVMGTLAIGSLLMYEKMFYLMQFVIRSLDHTDQGYFFFNVFSHALCLMVMLPATVCIGATLPIITHYLYKQTRDESVIGRVYAWNSLGSIVGVVAAMQLFMPVAGLKGLLIIGGAVDCGVGVAIAWILSGADARLRYGLALTTFIAVALPTFIVKLDPVLLSSGVFRKGIILKDKKMLYYSDGKTSSVSLYVNEGLYALANNGKVDASLGTNDDRPDGDEPTQMSMAAYALAYGRTIDTIGMIGLGSGMTCAMLLQHDGVKAVDIVEIEPRIVDGAKLMGNKTRKTFTDPRCRIYIDDAKSFFTSHKKKYRCIISEPSNPWVSGVSGLFSREFFDCIKRHLTDDGLLVQWFHTYEMSPELVACVLKALEHEFVDYRMYFFNNDLIILASKQPVARAPLRNLMTCGPIGRQLSMIGVEQTADLQCGFIGDRRSLHYLIGSFKLPANSDFHPVLDLNAVKSRFLNTDAFFFCRMPNFTLPISRMLWGDTTRIDGIYYGRRQSPLFSRSPVALPYTAKQIYYYITSLSDPAKRHFADSVVANDAVLTVRKVKMAQYDASEAVQKQWPKYVFTMLAATMPYLPPQELDTVWRFVDKIMASVTIRQDSKDYLSFLEACGKCDYRRMGELGKKLLAAERIADDQYNRITLTGTIIALVHSGEFKTLQEIWQKVDWKAPPDFTLMEVARWGMEQAGMQPGSALMFD